MNTTQTSPVDIVTERLEATGRECSKKPNGWIVASCPVEHNHENGDTRPSFGFREFVSDTDDTDKAVAFHCFGGCGRREILDALGLKEKDLYSNPDGKGLGAFRYTKEAQQAITLRDYGREKLLPLDFLMIQLGLYEGVFTFHKADGTPYKKKAIAIPYYYPDGNQFERAKLRSAMQKKNTPIFSWSEGDEKPISYMLQKVADIAKAGYCIICEGETDAQTLHYHDFPVIGIPGASNVRKTLDASLLKGIPVIYAIQEKTDQAGQNFPFEVQRHLQANGYTGKILRVPLKTLTGCKDPSELHIKLWDKNNSRDHERFREEFRKALDQAKPTGYDTSDEHTVDAAIIDKAIEDKDIDALFDVVSQIAQLSLADYGKYKARIKEAFGKNINLNDLEKAVNAERKKLLGIDTNNQLDLDYVASIFTERYQDTWGYDTNLQLWKKWVNTHWEEMMNDDESKSELDLIIVDMLHEHGFEVMRTGILDCVQRLIRAKCKRVFMPTPRRVNFLDGTLNLDTDTLEPHSREDNISYCLEYNYTSDGNFPTILSFLTSILCYPELDADGNKVPDWCAIQSDMALTGLALMRDTSMHHAEIVKGPPRAGKTSLMRLKNAVCGVVNRFAETLEERYGSFGGDDLFSPELEGKRARYMRNSQRIVCCDELSPDVFKDCEEMFKNMTSHSGVPMRGMMKNDTQANGWIPKLVMSTNNLPYYKDTSGGIKERLVYIQTPFHLTSSERDPELLNKMLSERQGYARACIALAKEMIKQRRYPKSSAMKELAGHAETNGNTLRSFIADMCVLEKSASVPKSALYAAFNTYRGNNGNTRDYSLPTMTTNLRDMDIGVHDNNNKSVRYKGIVCKCFFGIREKTEDELNSEVDKKGDVLTDDNLLLSLDALSWCNSNVTGCNSNVTGCNSNVTDEVTSSHGSTGGSTTTCNFVTKISENYSYVDTPPVDSVKGIGGLYATTNPQNPVTKLQGVMGQPVETSERCNRHSENGLQDGYTQVTTELHAMEDFWAVGKKHGYPEISDLGLRCGKMAWNSFSLTHRLRLSDVIARLAR